MKKDKVLYLELLSNLARKGDPYGHVSSNFTARLVSMNETNDIGIVSFYSLTLYLIHT